MNMPSAKMTDGPSQVPATASAPCPAPVAALLGQQAPAQLDIIGDRRLLSGRLVAVFCSRVCPATIVVDAQEAACALTTVAVTEISGFQSPLEQRFMTAATDAGRPVIQVCARDIRQRSFTPDQRERLSASRLLFISGVHSSDRWTTRSRALQRNFLVAALASTIVVVYARPGGGIDSVVRTALSWGRNVVALKSPHNEWMTALEVQLVDVSELGVAATTG